MADLTDEQRRKIVRGNAITLFGWTSPPDPGLIAAPLRLVARPSRPPRVHVRFDFAPDGMDLRYTASEQAFREELRAWLAATLPCVGPPPPHDDWPARRAYDLAWQRCSSTRAMRVSTGRPKAAGAAPRRWSS